jgi:hypothetical protein
MGEQAALYATKTLIKKDSTVLTLMSMTLSVSDSLHLPVRFTLLNATPIKLKHCNALLGMLQNLAPCQSRLDHMLLILLQGAATACKPSILAYHKRICKQQVRREEQQHPSHCMPCLRSAAAVLVSRTQAAVPPLPGELTSSPP